MSTTSQTVSIQSTPTGAPRTYTFSMLINGEELNEDHGVLEANWNFGDGNGSEEFEPTHTYNIAGSFQVEVEVIFQGPGKGDGDDPGNSDPDEDPPVTSAVTQIEVE